MISGRIPLMVVEAFVNIFISSEKVSPRGVVRRALECEQVGVVLLLFDFPHKVLDLGKHTNVVDFE